MIKRPVNFTLGILCLLCYIYNVVKGRDTFTIILSAIATVVNIMVSVI